MNASPKTRISLICALLFSLLMTSERSNAIECTRRTCVDVYVENGQIVIEGQKGAGGKSTSSVKKKVVAIPPKVKRVARKPTPAPKVTSTRRSPVYIPPRRVTLITVVPKKVVKKVLRKIAPAISFNDKLVRLLPTASIAKEPSDGALVNVPLIFWCNLPTVFTARVSVVGEVVDVTMRPSFLWSFGDGRFFATTEPGRPYPDQRITHAYSHSGTYIVTLLVTWGGTWAHNGVARAITGQIRKLSVLTLSVENGPTRFTQ